VVLGFVLSIDLEELKKKIPAYSTECKRG